MRRSCSPSKSGAVALFHVFAKQVTRVYLVFDKTQFVVTNGAMNFSLEKPLYVPENALPEEVSKCLINIKASVKDQFKLHWSYEFVGAVNWVAIPGRFTKLITKLSIVPISANLAAIHIVLAVPRNSFSKILKFSRERSQVTSIRLNAFPTCIFVSTAPKVNKYSCTNDQQTTSLTK